MFRFKYSTLVSAVIERESIPRRLMCSMPGPQPRVCFKRIFNLQDYTEGADCREWVLAAILPQPLPVSLFSGNCNVKRPALPCPPRHDGQTPLKLSIKINSSSCKPYLLVFCLSNEKSSKYTVLKCALFSLTLPSSHSCCVSGGSFYLPRKGE